MKMSSKGLFVTFEGGEGAGKTTLINSLEKEFTQSGYPVVVTREPGGTSLGVKIRSWLLNESEGIAICPLAELMLFLADRAQHIETVIQPALKSGRLVLCDRFNDSTIAYQGGGRGLGLARVKKLCDQVCGDIQPNLTFFLDIDPQTGFKRAKNERRVFDRLENEAASFHESIRSAFNELAREDVKRIVCLDASQSPQILVNQASEKIKAWL
jgi:dTMP kinase